MPSPSTAPVFYSMSAFARLANLDPRTVRAEINAGRIQAVRVGARSIRIRADQLDRLGVPITSVGGAA